MTIFSLKKSLLATALASCLAPYATSALALDQRHDYLTQSALISAPTKLALTTFPVGLGTLSGLLAHIRTGSNAQPVDDQRRARTIAASFMPKLPPDLMMTGSIRASFFGTAAIPFSNIASRKRWDDVRHRTWAPPTAACSTQQCRVRTNVLSDAVAGQGQPFLATLRSVNKIVNATITYTSDESAHGLLDYWAAPGETIRTGSGDCEDFAILKYALLREAGVPEQSMSLVVLRDRSRGLYHAVLTVSTNKGHFVLDNVQDNVYKDTSIAHYQPLYSFSADRSWIHGIPSGGEQRIATTQPLGEIAPGESAFDAAEWAQSGSTGWGQLRPTLVE